jgi:hypothetical protein
MKINSRIHGLIDYLVVLFLWASPSLFGLADATSTFTYALGAIHLVLTLLTDFEVGAMKIIPFPIHGWIELAVVVVLVGVAFYLGSIEGMIARNYFLAFASAVFLIWLITDYQSRTLHEE